MALKIPKNFDSKIFESDDLMTLFESDFDITGKAKAAALDIARINYKRLQKENQEGKLKLRMMCYDNGINLGEGHVSDEQMLQKLNTLEYIKLVDELTKCQETKLVKQDSKASMNDEPQVAKKKDLNSELIRMYDLYSHISRVNDKLAGCEEGLPLTEDDIEKFGLEEDILNVHKRLIKSNVVKGK